MNYQKNCDLIRQEISTFTIVNETAISSVYAQCEKSKRIFILAAGRSLLMMKGFAMRLMHIGYEVHVLDEVTCPAITNQDTLIVASGSGTTAGLVTKVTKAKQIGANIIVWTQAGDSPLANLSDVCVLLQKQTSAQPGASLFEQSLLLALDAFVATIMEEKQLLPDEVYIRHANLE